MQLGQAIYAFSCFFRWPLSQRGIIVPYLPIHPIHPSPSRAVARWCRIEAPRKAQTSGSLRRQALLLQPNLIATRTSSLQVLKIIDSHGHAGYIARRLLAVYQLVRTKHDELHICCAIGLVCFCPGQDVVRLEKILEHTQNKSETALSSEFAG